uniref:Transposase/IS protein n=1 Tax=Klebsiella pneumoniae TaxID=573 RepID=A0A2P1BP18_KLEPN|nr:transposase/IS protein [Klebsiella pneumoniae]
MRVHATLNERPIDRWRQEREHLQPLPSRVRRDEAPCWITVSARYHWNLSSTHCLSMTQLGGLPMNLQHERIDALCQQLKLERVATHYPVPAQQAVREDFSFTDFGTPVAA